MENDTTSMAQALEFLKAYPSKRLATAARIYKVNIKALLEDEES
jgi:hypothetical protein